MLPVKGTLLCAWSIYAVVYPIITTHIFIYIYIYLYMYMCTLLPSLWNHYSNQPNHLMLATLTFLII